MGAAREPRTFGVEEEYLLLDEASGKPKNIAAQLVGATPDQDTDREYFSSQIETATPVCHRASEAEDALLKFRASAATAARDRGAVLASSGLPPVGGDTVGRVTPKARYRRIESEMRSVAQHQYSTGTHVHVEVPSPDVGVEVLTRIARWAPALMALSTNSPLWCGERMGFASWRHVMGLSWPVAGYPLGFDNAAEYHRTVDQLVETGVVPDVGLLTWVARLSDRFPTVELRIADAQLEAGDAVAIAVLVRALIDRAVTETERGEARPRYTAAMINGPTWRAARDGLSSEIIDPLAAESMPAFALIDRMVGTVEAELDEFGDRERVDRYLQRLRDEGDPASRQLTAFEQGGVPALLELYRLSATR